MRKHSDKKAKPKPAQSFKLSCLSPCPTPSALLPTSPNPDYFHRPMHHDHGAPSRYSGDSRRQLPENLLSPWIDPGTREMAALHLAIQSIEPNHLPEAEVAIQAEYLIVDWVNDVQCIIAEAFVGEESWTIVRS